MLVACASAQAGPFVDDFDCAGADVCDVGPGWTTATGDGQATMTFTRAGGVGVVRVDARRDERNEWWALIRHPVTDFVDRGALARPDRELRVEARVRTATVPRRINLHFNHSRTTDFHSHLMEYDIATAGEWHLVSMTTRGFDAGDSDDIYVQLALMDWGRGTYRLDIDYIRVDVVDPAAAGADLGEPLFYRPDLPPPAQFRRAGEPVQTAVVDAGKPLANLDGGDGTQRVIAVGGRKIALLRWNPPDLAIRSNDWGLLELTTRTIGPDTAGELRVVEILAGDPDWRRETVTYAGLMQGDDADRVLNEQLVIDVPPNDAPGATTLMAISPVVLRRLASGRTRGLAIYAQGELDASFFADGPAGPKLYFDPVAAPSGTKETSP